ncbi:ABC transporter ATP-binding protein [Chelatococcus sp. GCM10030263]|uniref:ABC transporter ATP-binding protein n=1 Tax=Chelatococcus sp. GCM10030263 TaxID=3273387 RepID=UPI003619D0B3
MSLSSRAEQAIRPAGAGGQIAESGTARACKVRLSGVGKRYGAVTALHSTDLEVREGEFVTLLGPSGSGKTTMLNLIAGMTAPTSGRVSIDGRDVTDVPANKRELGMVFQHYALMPHMTIFENVAFPLRVRRRSRAEIDAEVAKALRLVRLPDLGARKPRELSGGQQQRIAIARCLVYSPSIILMDEPLGALDKKLREELQLELKRLHRELGITVLYVTHDQEEALTMSDRIVLMNGARIEQMGPPEELYFRPRSLFAATFLGDSNILDGTVKSTGTVVEVETAYGTFRSSEIEPGTAGVGDAVQILIRPENFHTQPASAERNDNRVTGQMVNSIAYGGVTKTFVRLSDDKVLVVQELTKAGRMTVEPGTPATLSWNAGDGRILPPAKPAVSAAG